MRIATAQTSVQDCARSRHHRVERVIAPHVVVGELAPTLLGQSVGLVDGRVHVVGQGLVAWSCSHRPGPGQELTRDGVELSGVPPAETA